MREIIDLIFTATAIQVDQKVHLSLSLSLSLFFLHIFLRSFSTSLFFNTEINTQFASV